MISHQTAGGASASSAVPLHLLHSYEPPVGASDVARWQGWLDAGRPPTDDTSRLVVVWEPGDPWAPCGRWMLYDCLPERALRRFAQAKAKDGRADDENYEAWLIQNLDGPSPREDGYYDAALGRFVGSRQSDVTLTQWRLWRDKRVYGRPFWVVQGERGGHLWSFDEAEQRELRLMGLPDDPPNPGSLPYAPVTRRTVAQVLAYDRCKRAEAKLGKLGEVAAKAQADQIRGLRGRYLTVLEEQFRDHVEWMAGKSGMGRANRSTPDWLAEAEHEFIDRGFAAPLS